MSCSYGEHTKNKVLFALQLPTPAAGLIPGLHFLQRNTKPQTDFVTKKASNGCFSKSLISLEITCFLGRRP